MRGGIKMSKKQWYAKSIYLVIALGITVGLWLAPAVSAAPAERHVGPGQTYTKIQNALNDANEWDEIIVHPATYSTATNNETFPLVVNDNNLLIRSTNGAALTIIDAGGALTNILEIENRDNVDVVGFTLTNATCCHFWANGKGILMTNSTNCDISNMVIHNIHAVGCDGEEPMGIFADDGCDNNTFSSIEIYDITSPNTARGIYLRRNSDGNTFSRINIHDLSVTDNVAFGIHVNGKGEGCQFNEFSDVTIERIVGGDWAEGIELQDGSDNNTFGDLSISDVTATYHAYGIKLGDSCDNTFGSSSEIWNIIAPDGAGDAIGIGVEMDPSLGSNRNTFTSFDIHDTEYGFFITGSQDNTLTKSNIHDNVQGVRINTSMSGGNKVNCNNIYDNTEYGVYKQNPPDVDATNNWWGDASGPSHSPGNGDTISLNVLYDPWLLDQFQYCLDCGGCPRTRSAAVPTVNQWGIVAMITLFAGLLVWRVRRRRLAS
jgi:parallel beta-helix repeat protein